MSDINYLFIQQIISQNNKILEQNQKLISLLSEKQNNFYQIEEMSDISESDISESDISESDISESETSESDISESETLESDISESEKSSIVTPVKNIKTKKRKHLVELVEINEEIMCYSSHEIKNMNDNEFIESF